MIKYIIEYMQLNIYAYATYGLVDHLVWWDGKIITSLQIMNKYQRNHIHRNNFIVVL